MSAADFDPVFQSAGQQYGVDPAILKALAQQESNFNPNAVNKDTGAAGIMQYIPASAKAIGLNPLDPVASINQAAKDFSGNMQRFNGNVEQAVAAHFAGPDQKLWGPKTSQYVSDVANKYQAIRQSGGFASNPSAAAQANPGQPDDIDAMLASRAKGATVGATPAQQASGQSDDVDTMLAARAAGKQIQPAQVPASAAGGAGTAAVQSAAGQPVPVTNGFLTGVGDAIKGGVQSMAHGGAWLANKVAPDAQFTKDLNAALPQIDQNIASQEQAYQAQRQAAQPQNLSSLITGQKPEPGIDWWRLAGNAVGAAPLALASPETAGMGILGRTAVGAGLGAANSVLTPVTDTSQPYADQKLSQTGVGALTGGAAVPVAAGAGALVRGVTDPVRQRLAAAGVQMTPGQILGGALQRTEDKLTSVPVLGDFIKNAQQRSVQSFNRSAYNSALEPIGQTVPNNIGTGSAGVAYVRNQIGNVYQSIEPRATFVADQNFANDLAGIRNNLAQMAPGALPQFDNVVRNQIESKVAGGAIPQGGTLPIGGTMTGAQWGDTRSMIGRVARAQSRGDASVDQMELADALRNLNGAVNDAVMRSSPPDIQQTLNRANAAYSQYKQIEAAAGLKAARDNGNIFTAAQYSNGVGKNATAFQKATNSGLNGQMAADATDVLGSKYPDSGTVGRSLLTLGLGAAAGHAAAPGVVVPAALGIGVGSLPYTAYGQRLAQALLMNRPGIAAPIGNAISTFGPAAGVLAAPAVAR